ncbi:hypothetical protein DFA_04996 [Cavenderia fasciculata]|uniref:Uncharacterized protein n=1 Tax=Cavenderia fasciculata TaxID=261658 RepID=F4PMX3_CACFS|nr:uncharacterized protein DFA_04996 [Cavenderia fasciculata]EGG22866.1 hypothetical protein DFA_04996 [Cavenderia fasciculata]|eukprot:XP_004360717.1 hypothetical protein DFA_04996 [Cavenderia fasciculata]
MRFATYILILFTILKCVYSDEVNMFSGNFGGQYLTPAAANPVSGKIDLNITKLDGEFTFNYNFSLKNLAGRTVANGDVTIHGPTKVGQSSDSFKIPLSFTNTSASANVLEAYGTTKLKFNSKEAMQLGAVLPTVTTNTTDQQFYVLINPFTEKSAIGRAQLVFQTIDNEKDNGGGDNPSSESSGSTDSNSTTSSSTSTSSTEDSSFAVSESSDNTPDPQVSETPVAGNETSSDSSDASSISIPLFGLLSVVSLVSLLI